MARNETKRQEAIGWVARSIIRNVQASLDVAGDASTVSLDLDAHFNQIISAFVPERCEHALDDASRTGRAWRMFKRAVRKELRAELETYRTIRGGKYRQAAEALLAKVA